MPQKYEREIDEILSRLDKSPPPSGRVLTPLPPIQRPPPRGPSLSWRPAFRLELNSSSLMIAALSLAILSYPLQWIYPPAVAVAGLVSAGMLIASVLLSIFKWNRAGPTKTWRGQPLTTGGGFSTTWLARRWRRWKAHRRFRDPRWN